VGVGVQPVLRLGCAANSLSRNGTRQDVFDPARRPRGQPGGQLTGSSDQ